MVFLIIIPRSTYRHSSAVAAADATLSFTFSFFFSFSWLPSNHKLL